MRRAGLSNKVSQKRGLGPRKLETEQGNLQLIFIRPSRQWWQQQDKGVSRQTLQE